MTTMPTSDSHPLERPGRLATFVLRRVAVSLVLALLTTAVVLVGVRSGELGGTVSLEYHDSDVAEETEDAPGEADPHIASH